MSVKSRKELCHSSDLGSPVLQNIPAFVSEAKWELIEVIWIEVETD